MTAISIQQVPDVDAATGLAVTYVAAHAPFGAYRADRLVGAVAGQIRRRHYAFAVRNGIAVGYVGWALCSREIARKWLEHNEAPTSEQCSEGDVLVVTMVVADDAEALRRLHAYLRKRYNGRPYMGLRSSKAEKSIRQGRMGHGQGSGS
ncbi:hypothetical protein [Microvirga makkahensis]|uniref:Toxin-activating lysine-acyltransferase n=1 Tax=Microvirga makkahensis TaxID=1128670 RepID=A0A7X3MN26_9HYPH|nr:hypothetical protein [Microvirga makkahensis]MXQ10012.1 hypothetical protein [Microvirga makkahensis]